MNERDVAAGADVAGADIPTGAFARAVRVFRSRLHVDQRWAATRAATPAFAAF
jgi:hypothetical protein